MISFYPGPSRVHDDIPKYVKDAFKKGIMSINHRSDTFMEMCEKTVRLLKAKLEIPRNYTIFFTSSATECWEIIAQSLIKEESLHFFNGAFGQKWFDYTHRLHPAAKALAFNREEKIIPSKLDFRTRKGVICITQNETSNGTQVSNDLIESIKKKNRNHLVAVDATSSIAGIFLNFKAADIWLASVQKCFGLPAGLGILVCSPEAIHLAERLKEKDHYNSLLFMTQMMDKWQTPYTPNVLSIYLLMRVMEKVKSIHQVHEKTVGRYEEWENHLEKSKTLHHLIRNKEVRSYTVLPIEAEPFVLNKIKSSAKSSGFLLGEGYGELKSATFRIANFPAIKKKEIAKLMKFFATNV